MPKSTTPVESIRCPQCLSRVALKTKRCDCGYDFEALGPAQSQGGEGLVAKAERLYETFLSARTLRARKAVIDLRARRLRSLRDESLLRQLRTAEKELRTLEMQLMAQNTKAQEAQPATRPSEPADTEVITEVIDPPIPDAELASLSPEPTEAFRQTQAARATLSPRARLGTDFTAAQTRRAEAVMAAKTESVHRVCPECEATLSPSAPQCVCGYNFRLAKKRPAFLSEEETRALRGE